MNKKPPTTKKTQTKTLKPPFYKQKWVIIVGVIILLIAGWIIYSKISLSNHKKEAKLDAEKVVQIVKQAPGTVVYEDVQDEGCKTGPRGWFSTYTGCSVKGVVVLKNKGNSAADVQKLVQILGENGYTRKSHYESSIDNGKNVIISLSTFDKKKELPASTMTPQNMFDIDKEIPLSEGEYLYGATIKATYAESWGVDLSY